MKELIQGHMPAINQYHSDLFLCKAEAEHDRATGSLKWQFLLGNLEPIVPECGKEFDGDIHLTPVVY